MRIGFTYDLRDDFPAQGLADDEAAECESQDTVQAIADTIVSLGYDVDRIGHVIPYTFSDPLTLGLSLHKGMAKRVVRDCGVATPPFVVVEHVRDLRALSLPFPVFAKPVAEGSSKGISRRSIAETPEALAAICETLLDRYQQPVLVEEHLPGREFTVGIVGSGARARSLGAMEISLTDLAEPGVYSRHNKVHYNGRVS
jgi:D-alanine-D-alanine ligase